MTESLFAISDNEDRSVVIMVKVLYSGFRVTQTTRVTSRDGGGANGRGHSTLKAALSLYRRSESIQGG